MDKKNKGLPAGFGGWFKGLPVVKRINVLLIARKLLKLQREQKALLEDDGEQEGGK